MNWNGKLNSHMQSSKAEGALHLSETKQLPLIVGKRVGLRESDILLSALFLFMIKISLRKIKPSDKNYFAKWWRDKELLKLTSGILKLISDEEVDKYFQTILNGKDDYNFTILADGEIIGHISLAKRRNNWHETQIVIGEKNYWGKGFGSKAIKLLIRKARKNGISKIYLEVRPTNLRAIQTYEQCGFEKVRIVKYPKNKYLPKILRMEFKS